MARRNIADQVPTEPVDVLTRRPSRAKRNREWERRKRQAAGFVGYRGIPPELNAEIKEVAQDLQVTMGDVARAFLECGLEAYRRGDLKLEPKSCVEKFTLYPTE